MSKNRVFSDIELQTHDEAQVLRLISLVSFGDGSGYCCDLFVRSRGFSCERPFYFDDLYLPDAIKSLELMAGGSSGEAVLKGAWETDYIKFVSNDLGHVFVSGEVSEHSDMAQSLKFGFRTDQTALVPLLRDLRPLLNA